jgi:hypothetical protein
MVLGIPGGLETLVISCESATLSVLKARLTSRTPDELHLVTKLSGLYAPFLLDFARGRGHAGVFKNGQSIYLAVRRYGETKRISIIPLQATYGASRSTACSSSGSARCRHMQSAGETRQVTASVLNS